MRTFDQEQSTFGYALLLYIVIVVVLITLIPFEFRIPDNIQIYWTTNYSDFFTNIILFLPVGFIFRLSRRTNQDRFGISALIFGIFLSVAIEVAQIFVHGRYTQIFDAITNGSGAWLGGFIFVFLKRTLKEERTARLPVRGRDLQAAIIRHPELMVQLTSTKLILNSGSDIYP
jgi:glycopeptide antibiotics resistance protein